jgi:hypothetical protein
MTGAGIQTEMDRTIDGHTEPVIVSTTRYWGSVEQTEVAVFARQSEGGLGELVRGPVVVGHKPTTGLQDMMGIHFAEVGRMNERGYVIRGPGGEAYGAFSK